MWLVFLLIIFLLLGIVNSTLEANLYRIEFKNNKLKVKLIIDFKLFGLLKIFHIVLNEKEIKFLNKKITYNKIILKAKQDNIEISKINFNFCKNIINKFNFNVGKFYFELRVGLVDISLTNIAIVFISSLLPIFVNNKVEKRKLKYKVLPEYNKFCISFNGKISISLKFLKLIKTYFKNIKPEFTHNKSKNYDVKESW